MPQEASPIYSKATTSHIPAMKAIADANRDIEVWDEYYLTVLAWSRPNDCSRYPITTKLNDRFLGEEATDYDTDALNIEAILEEENINE